MICFRATQPTSATGATLLYASCSLTAHYRACQEADSALEADAAAALGAVDARLRDNLDTRGALDALLDLILRTNKYLEQRSDSGAAGVACLRCIECVGLRRCLSTTLCACHTAHAQ